MTDGTDSKIDRSISRREVLKTLFATAAFGPLFLERAIAAPVLPIETFVASLSWAQDSSKIAVGYKQHAAAIVEAASGRVLKELYPKTLAPVDKRISVTAEVNMARTNWYPISWSPDGKLIAVNHYLTVYVLDAQTGRVVSSRTSERGRDFNPERAEDPLLPSKKGMSGDGWREILSYVASVAWAPDSRRLAISDANGTHIFDATTGRDIYTYEPMQHQTYCTSWSKDGKFLAGVTYNFSEHFKSLHIWNAADGKTVTEFKGIKHLCWAPDSKLLAYDEYRGIAIYDTVTKKVRNRFKTRDEFPSFTWSPDGKHLAVSDRDDCVLIHDALTGLVKANYRKSCGGSYADVFPAVFAWSPDGKKIAIGREEFTVGFWSPKLG
jgi:WD40 repeat protein